MNFNENTMYVVVENEKNNLFLNNSYNVIGVCWSRETAQKYNGPNRTIYGPVPILDKKYNNDNDFIEPFVPAKPNYPNFYPPIFNDPFLKPTFDEDIYDHDPFKKAKPSILFPKFDFKD